MSRLSVIKVFCLDQLFVILSMILSQITRKQLQVDLRLILIDSLSSLFATIQGKSQQYYSSIKDILILFETLAKKHHVGIVFTNNTMDATVSRTTDLRNQVGEPLESAVDKKIFAKRLADGINAH